MPFRNLLKRRSKTEVADQNNPYNSQGTSEKEAPPQRPHNNEDHTELRPPVPIVQIMRSTTNSQELLTAPSFSPATTMPIDPQNNEKENSRQAQHPSNPSSSPPAGIEIPKSEKSAGKRLSSILHLNRRSRASSAAGSDEHTPRGASSELAPFPLRGDANDEADGQLSEEQRQARWEKRATLLVQGTTKPASIPPSPGLTGPGEEMRKSFDFPSSGVSRKSSTRAPAAENWPLPGPDPAHAQPEDGASAADDDIQLAIQMHETGDLQASTLMFGRLADPNGQNNALAQVLYGLALRHGWGITPDQDLAIQYLTHSARNASQLTSSLASRSTTNTSPKLTLNLNPGPPSTSTATPTATAAPLLNRGELTLAIYELGNCHRNGWGVAKSPALAMQYFEAAAELGDTDAMVEVAGAYEKGVRGWRAGKKDRAMAAMWYRRAERNGRKEVGNSWIWKEKYDGPG